MIVDEPTHTHLGRALRALLSTTPSTASPIQTSPIRPCLISSANGAIGSAIAQQLVKEGRRVALTHSPLDRPCALLPAGETTRWYQLEEQSPSSMRTVISRIAADFGAAPDLCYCGGLAPSATAAMIDDERWTQALETNLFGAYRAARAVAMDLAERGDGRIVLTCSLDWSGHARQTIYSAVRSGLEGLCRVLAARFGRHQLTCNLVAAAPIVGSTFKAFRNQTPEPPARTSLWANAGQTDEVAQLAALLLGSGGRYVTGQTFQVDGDSRVG